MLEQLAPADTRLVRALVYRFLATMYLAEPDAGWLTGLARDGLLDEFPVQDEAGVIDRGLGLLRPSLQRLAAEGRPAEAEAAAIRRDFYTLFAGPGHVPAPPWESVYRTEERLLFDWPTHAVRQAYRTMAIRTARPDEADDHIGLELLFLALLDERAAGGDASAATAHRQFLREHVLQWAHRFCEDVRAAAETDFWRGVALVTSGVLALEHGV
ncbi:MAG: molecular chaperone TorD family protein [Chloroflexi bacterium]|nr:molecular chaperone TorD family protein [Chloroflexota bacterium]